MSFIWHSYVYMRTALTVSCISIYTSRVFFLCLQPYTYFSLRNIIVPRKKMGVLLFLLQVNWFQTNYLSIFLSSSLLNGMCNCQASANLETFDFVSKWLKFQLFFFLKTSAPWQLSPWCTPLSYGTLCSQTLGYFSCRNWIVDEWSAWLIKQDKIFPSVTLWTDNKTLSHKLQVSLLLLSRGSKTLSACKNQKAKHMLLFFLVVLEMTV